MQRVGRVRDASSQRMYSLGLLAQEGILRQSLGPSLWATVIYTSADGMGRCDWVPCGLMETGVREHVVLQTLQCVMSELSLSV